METPKIYVYLVVLEKSEGALEILNVYSTRRNAEDALTAHRLYELEFNTNPVLEICEFLVDAPLAR